MKCDDGIKDLPTREKASLLGRDDQGKNAEESRSENLGNDLVEGIAEAYGPEFVQSVSSQNLWDEDQESSIKFFEQIPGPKEFLNHLNHILLNHIPISMKKEGRESIWA